MADYRVPTIMQTVRDIITVIVAPLLGWLLLTVVDVQKEVIMMKVQLAQAAKDIKDHSNDSKDDSRSMGIIHHTTNVYPCNGCHKAK